MLEKKGEMGELVAVTEQKMDIPRRIRKNETSEEFFNLDNPAACSCSLARMALALGNGHLGNRHLATGK